MFRSPLVPRLLAAVALLALAACSDPQPSAPRISSPRSSLSGVASCSRTDAQFLSSQIRVLFAQSVRSEAGALERAVEMACGSATATVPTLDYVEKILKWRSDGLILSTVDNTARWTYLSTLFRYVGYKLDNTEGALGEQGFIGVCDERSPGSGYTLVDGDGNSATAQELACDVVAPRKTSAVRLFFGALDGKRYLVTGAPTSCSASGDLSTILRVYGQCVNVSLDPKDGRTSALAPVAGKPHGSAIVQTCFAETTPHHVFELDGASPQSAARLTRLSGSGATATRSVRATAPRVVDSGTGCNDATLITQAPTPLERAGGIMLASAQRVGSWLLPAEAFAGHSQTGELPGFTDGFSVFGPADGALFSADFESPPNTVGQFPADSTSIRGSWLTVGYDAPGEIAVRSGLGDIASQLVVLNQGGGNSQSQLGIQLIAHLGTKTARVYPTAGKYLVTWQSVVGSTRALGMSLVLRSPLTVNDTGPRSPANEIARFSYVDGQSASAGKIHFSTTALAGATDSSLTWRQNVSGRFYILVDLDNGVAKFGTVSLTGVQTQIASSPIMQSARTFARFGWESRGRDGQTIGWDNPRVVVLPSTY